MEKQHTLASPAKLSGNTLHTGASVKMTILPAPPGHGFKFRRKDLTDEPIIEAIAANVRQVERATTLVEGQAKVHTVEHILSALVGLGVDNALIDMSASEAPIGDGSAGIYVEAILKAGIVEQEVARTYIEPRDPIFIETPTSFLTVFPDTKFRISCTQVGPQGRFTQFLSAEITPEFYEKQIAPARTFVFYEEVKPLMDKGLIKGGSLENAVVARGDTVLSKEPLRFPDEFVRHKILDIIGDLALAGRPIRGHVVAIKPGHNANSLLAKSLAKSYAEVLAMVPPPQVAQPGALGIQDVIHALPHRYPFLMVDRVIELDDETGIAVGVKSVSINEPFFQGHFPGHPVMPGVLQLESMAQVSSILMMRRTSNQGKIGYFMSADSVKFRKPVFPGDTLFIHCKMLSMKRKLAKAACVCRVNGEVVSEAELLFGILDE